MAKQNPNKSQQGVQVSMLRKWLKTSGHNNGMWFYCHSSTLIWGMFLEITLEIFAVPLKLIIIYKGRVGLMTTMHRLPHPSPFMQRVIAPLTPCLFKGSPNLLRSIHSPRKHKARTSDQSGTQQVDFMVFDQVVDPMENPVAPQSSPDEQAAMLCYQIREASIHVTLSLSLPGWNHLVVVPS